MATQTKPSRIAQLPEQLRDDMADTVAKLRAELARLDEQRQAVATLLEVLEPVGTAKPANGRARRPRAKRQRGAVRTAGYEHRRQQVLTYLNAHRHRLGIFTAGSVNADMRAAGVTMSQANTLAVLRELEREGILRVEGGTRGGGNSFGFVPVGEQTEQPPTTPSASQPQPGDDVDF